MMDVDCRAVIERSPWFEGVPSDALDTLAAAASVRRIPVDGYIYRLGEPTEAIYCLVTGRVRISVSSPNGQEFAVIDRENEAWLGEPALMGDEPRVIDACVIADAEVLSIPRQTVLAVADEHPLVYRNLFRHVQANTRGLYELLAGILFYPLRSRVAGRLLQLVEEHGEPSDQGVRIDIRISQSDFARLALGSRQRVNRVFREWDQMGLVVSDGDHLLVRDVEGLRAQIQLPD